MNLFFLQVAQEEQERIEREKARIQKQELPLPLQQEVMLCVPTLKICIFFLYCFEWRECYASKLRTSQYGISYILRCTFRRSCRRKN